MKDMAIYTRVNPAERIKRLTSFANRLLSTPAVKSFLMKQFVVNFTIIPITFPIFEFLFKTF